ncbi:type II toxin-antitoxin system RelE/ParE family toxin [bacterium]|jgi:plasmid stabilization system protein ParE|nr:type II toxin-antitoxin system RelE/ParE family toxin [bacterium]
MTNRKIIITEKAQDDINNIEQYIACDNLCAAKEFVIKLKKSFINLSLYPRLGKNRPEFSGDNRILFLPVMTNYLIVYTIIENNLYIVRVLTKYQNISSIL